MGIPLLRLLRSEILVPSLTDLKTLRPVVDSCLRGMDGVCPKGAISGYYTPGTYQQYALGPASYVTPIPDALESAAAAPFRKPFCSICHNYADCGALKFVRA